MNADCISRHLRYNRPPLIQRSHSGKLAVSNALDQMKSVTTGTPPAWD
jgi:hypothetical protein